MAEAIISFASDPEKLDVDLISKWLKPNTSDLLKKYVEKMEVLDVLNHDILLEAAREVAAEFDVKLVAIAQPLRLALTGSTQSPGIFELIAILGKEKSVVRVKKLIEKLG